MLEHLLDLADLDVVGAVVRVVDADIGIWLGTGGATLEGNLFPFLSLRVICCLAGELCTVRLLSFDFWMFPMDWVISAGREPTESSFL